jgi:succinate dehydrogenase/fumarate reductase-like Fe-S protein
MRLSISRYDPDHDRSPHLQDYEIEPAATDRGCVKTR